MQSWTQTQCGFRGKVMVKRSFCWRWNARFATCSARTPVLDPLFSAMGIAISLDDIVISIDDIIVDLVAEGRRLAAKFNHRLLTQSETIVDMKIKLPTNADKGAVVKVLASPEAAEEMKMGLSSVGLELAAIYVSGSNGGMSGGAIATIILGVLALLGVLVVAIVLGKKKSAGAAPPSGSSAKATMDVKVNSHA